MIFPRVFLRFARQLPLATFLVLLLELVSLPAAGQIRRPCGRRVPVMTFSRVLRSRPALRFFASPCRKSTPIGNSAKATAIAEAKWTSLFDGRTLNGWQAVEFGGDGEIDVQDGAIQLDFGEMLTGVTYQDAFPKTDYEVRLKAMRKDGIDFFCGLTFPVDDTHCTLIVAGWAGAVVGLSNIDHRDASDNETTSFMNFDNDRWYQIRVRVTPERIQAWIDDKRVVNQDIRERHVSTRPEVDLSKPLGIAAWQSRAALRDIEYRLLP